MARGKPLTRFLLALVHSRELMDEYRNPDRRSSLLVEWGVADNDLFQKGELTLDRARDAVAAEHEAEGMSVDVAFWIWFLGGPPKKPDWVWGVDEEPDDDNGTGTSNGDDEDAGDDDDPPSGPFGGGG